MTLKVGIIGAGQLGLYLCQSARDLGLATCLWSETSDAPAAPFADMLVVGELDEPAALERFIDSADVVTFEKEAIPDATLRALAAAEEQGRVRVHPSAQTLLMLKDKGLQKQWLEEHGIPTLPFRLLDGDDIDADALAEEFGLPLVQKARRGGYDGRGVQILRDEAALKELWPTPSLVEPFLGGSREISVLLARDAGGNTRAWPTLGMDFDPVLNSLTTVHTPAGLPRDMENEALELGTRVVETLEGVGVFAIEMFISPEDVLYVNEISPRVHNSGHLTMEASATSQFEQHLRAVAGLPLGDVDTERPAAMAVER